MRRLIFAAAILATSAIGHAEEPCELKTYGSIKFETDESGHIFVPATVAGRSTRLLLDTGSFWSIVRRDLAEAQGLSIGTSLDLNLYDLAGDKLKSTTTADVKLGTLGYGDTDFFVGGAPKDSSIETDGGVIGQNMLARVDLEVDNAGKTITFFSQDHCKGAGVYWADESVTLRFRKAPGVAAPGWHIKKVDKNQIDMPIVAAELEGEPVSVLIDTGATYTSIDLGHARRKFGIGPDSPGVEPAGKFIAANGNAVDGYKYTFKSLTIAGIKFENVPVILADLDAQAKVLLGMHELKLLHIYFAWKDGLIHVTAADATHAPPQQPK